MPVFGPRLRPGFWSKVEAFERPFGGVDLSADQAKARSSMLDIEDLDAGEWSAIEVATEVMDRKTFSLHL